MADQVLLAEANGFHGAQADGECSWLGVAFLAILFPLEGQCCHPVHLVSAEGVNPPWELQVPDPAPSPGVPTEASAKLTPGAG